MPKAGANAYSDGKESIGFQVSNDVLRGLSHSHRKVAVFLCGGLLRN
jgi:hypothetical protein